MSGRKRRAASIEFSDGAGLRYDLKTRATVEERDEPLTDDFVVVDD